jgi:hypothetical protein
MLIIPEQRCVVLQPPRTGSTSIRDAVLSTYPKAFSPYRHMERPGIPDAYVDWQVICILRHPLSRLVSLYAHMSDARSTTRQLPETRRRRLAQDVARPFHLWLEQSQEMFSDPFDEEGGPDAYYKALTAIPIVRKSLSHWARADMGPVELLRLEEPTSIESRLGITLPHLNRSTADATVTTSARIQEHLDRHFAWDLSHYAHELM